MNKTVLIIGIIIAVISGIVWFSKSPQVNSGHSGTNQFVSSNQVKLVSPQQFADLAKDESSFILDVHIPEQTHIPGTDAFIPFNQIRINTDKLPGDKSAPILVYCRSGSMSAQASKEIISLGYTNVYDLDGGTNAYKKQQISVKLFPSRQDLGTVIYGEVASTDFTLTNYTPFPLKITRISTSCGCTKAEAGKEELGAFDSTDVKVFFDPAVHKDDTDLGNLSRTIYIETDNPDFPELESTITAAVVKNK